MMALVVTTTQRHQMCGDQPREISMLPYQIYQCLTDERVRELLAEARRQAGPMVCAA